MLLWSWNLWISLIGLTCNISAFVILWVILFRLKLSSGESDEQNKNYFAYAESFFVEFLHDKSDRWFGSVF